MPSTINALSASCKNCENVHLLYNQDNFLISRYRRAIMGWINGGRKKKNTHGYIYSLAILDLIEFQAFVRHSSRFSRPFRSQCCVSTSASWLMGIRMSTGSILEGLQHHSRHRTILVKEVVTKRMRRLSIWEIMILVTPLCRWEREEKQ